MKTLLERIEEAENNLKELIELALKEHKKDNFPKTWEELKEVEGFYIDSDSSIKKIMDGSVKSDFLNKNITPTEKEAKSYLAACQLRQLAKVINDNQTEDEWVDWNSKTKDKYYPYFNNETKLFVIRRGSTHNYNGIHFKMFEDLERSLIEHKELWLTYFKVSSND